MQITIFEAEPAIDGYRKKDCFTLLFVLYAAPLRAEEKREKQMLQNYKKGKRCKRCPKG